MKYYFIILILIAIGIYSCKSDPVSEVTPDYSIKFTRIQNLIDSTWNDYSGKNKIPDSCGLGCYISINGVNHFFRTSSISSINENYRFRIASNTKVFTAAAIMMLHQSGKLNINDTISQRMPNQSETYLPGTVGFNIPFKNRITIKQLLQHRAGVFDLANSPVPAGVKQPYAGMLYYSYIVQDKGGLYQFSIDELIKVLADCQIYYSEPGKELHYSNTGFQILAKIIERVSGKTYTDFINTEIIQKLGLVYTSTPWISTDASIPLPYIPGYVILQEGLFNTTEANMSFNLAEGNIISSFSDMNKWIGLLFSGQAGISKDNISKMQDYSDNPAEKFGLGVEYFDGIGYGHTGAHAGYSSKAIYNPELNMSVTFLSNFWDYTGEMDSFRMQYNYTMGLVNNIVNVMKN